MTDKAKQQHERGYFEKTPKTVHGMSPLMGGEFTWCGDAFDLDDAGLWRVTQNPINCSPCLEVLCEATAVLADHNSSLKAT